MHVDFAGPFFGAMWLILVDAYSSWPEIVQVSKITTGETIKVLRSIFARMGLPEVLVSDNGPAFKSVEFQLFCENNGIRHVTSPPYNPQSNGIAERMVQTFKKALKTMTGSGSGMNLNLCQFLLRYRSSPQPNSNLSPAEKIFGRNIRTTLDLLKADSKFSENSQSKHKENKALTTYNVGSKVWARSYAGEKRWILCEVIKPLGRLVYEVLTPDGGV